MNIRPPQQRRRPLDELVNMLTRRLAATAAQGARPILFAATAPQVHGVTTSGPQHGPDWAVLPPVRSSDRSHDPERARRLWQVSEEMTGVRFDLPAGTRSPRDSPETIRGFEVAAPRRNTPSR
jgi:hypothetical protein